MLASSSLQRHISQPKQRKVPSYDTISIQIQPATYHHFRSLQLGQVMDTSVHTTKGLGTKKRTQIVYADRNGRSYTRLAAHTQENIESIYGAKNA